ncbi:MAG TPA: hypothetical protein VIX19_01990 [Terriglobales bacterium]
MKQLLGFFSLVLLGAILYAQQAGQPAPEDVAAATQAMGHHSEDHQHMGAHMHMTELRNPQPGDQEKAQHVVAEVRQALEKYKNSNAALADGFKIFLPNVPQKMYHFSKWQYAVGETFRFDPTKPTSLLYEKRGGEYQLIGAMYTAPFGFTEDQLNERIPLSVAEWHQHVNMCRPPRGREREMLAKNPEFGLRGSISTQAACEAAGGTFMTHVFGWMVHVYPWEKTPDKIWSVERQLNKTTVQKGDHDDMPGVDQRH